MQLLKIQEPCPPFQRVSLHKQQIKASNSQMAFPRQAPRSLVPTAKLNVTRQKAGLPLKRGGQKVIYGEELALRKGATAPHGPHHPPQLIGHP